MLNHFFIHKGIAKFAHYQTNQMN